MEGSKEKLIHRLDEDPKKALVRRIEKARKRLNDSMDAKDSYEVIYRYSVELDHLIEQYIIAGY